MTELLANWLLLALTIFFFGGLAILIFSSRAFAAIFDFMLDYPLAAGIIMCLLISALIIAGPK